MLARESPCCVAVPRHIHHWKCFAHAISLLRMFNSLVALRLGEIVKSSSNGRIRTRAIPAAAFGLDCGIAVVSAASEPPREETITKPPPSVESQRDVCCALIAQPAALDMSFAIA